MIRCVVSLLAFGLCLGVMGQIGILPHDSVVDLSPTRAHRIIAEGWADYNANTVFNELPWNIYQGGYIERSLRERSRDALQRRNSLGYDVGARLSWLGADSLFGRARMKPLVSLAYRNMLGVRFAADVYELAFFGNAHYEDRTAVLGPTSHAQLTWQSVGFGIQDAVSRSFIRLDLLRGRSFNSSDIRTASLYTAPDGRYLIFSSDAEYWSTDTAGLGEEHTNGMGLSFSGRLNSTLNIGTTRTDISFTVEDVGLMYWNANSLYIRPNGVTRFEGVPVENIFGLGEMLIGEEQLLDTFGLRYERGAYTSIMPFRLALGMDVTLDQYWKTGIHVDHRYLPGYVPQVMLNASRRLGGRMLLGASATYGGFGVLRFGLATRIRIGEVLLVDLGTTHAPGFFLGNTRGVGAFIGISAGF